MRLFSFGCTASVYLVGLFSVCAINVIAPVMAADSPQTMQESVALVDAREKVKDINWQIGQAESGLRQLSPPVRTTDSKGTTFDADKQRQYETNRARIDRQIRDLKSERTIWELRVSQLAIVQDVLNRAGAVPAVAPAPIPSSATTRAPESVAVMEARKKVKDVDWEIGLAESALRQLSPPVRVTDSKGTTFDADKQQQYERNRARIDRQIRDLKEERIAWELRVNQLVLADNFSSPR